MNRYVTATLALAIFALGGCAAPYGGYSPYSNTAGGALLGGATGAVVGHQIDDDEGKYVGGIIGAMVGGAIGHSYDLYYSGGAPYYGNPGYYQSKPGYYQSNPGYYQSNPGNGYAPYPPAYQGSGGTYYRPPTYGSGSYPYSSGY